MYTPLCDNRDVVSADVITEVSEEEPENSLNPSATNGTFQQMHFIPYFAKVYTHSFPVPSCCSTPSESTSQACTTSK